MKHIVINFSTGTIHHSKRLNNNLSELILSSLRGKCNLKLKKRHDVSSILISQYGV